MILLKTKLKQDLRSMVDKVVNVADKVEVVGSVD